ncbi:Demethylspheroidene O-methyltransferase [Roseobacter fucihabitans]|uniref:Demethylspheroidene O-methyltransferase n=1 Tax=Roseobacter fucihabitans TaxID=1537242 RepID=A0ABZ2C0X9_9RHOB|nr:methyltransferase [Roseobacter litoralis]MBC6965124.1 Demethylspheroidene O-methyltransferase [Roseobacter litoralis]MBC6965873.1 Demethylspheroidene O-methyltransferase [Roseobacter litoralis]
MSETAGDLPEWRGGWLNRLVARPGFQSWASKFPLTRRQARKDGAVLFDVVQGFVQSQVLMALVELDIFRRLRGGAQSAEMLGRATQIPTERMQVLLQAAAALKLLKRDRAGRFALARKGAALMGVPGLDAMIRHHRAFYADLADPVGLLRGPAQTELSDFWPYVFGARGDIDPVVAETYSDLMAKSQLLVAEDTLRAVSFKGAKHLLDIGGGTGAFLEAVGQATPSLQMTLFDLPQVTPAARARFDAAGMSTRVQICPGSFRDDPLPQGADMISLIRVLYDHADETIEALLRAVYAALPAGGRLLISEPMGGGSAPDAAGDVYFAFYTMAMQTGRARSPAEITALCKAAGFEKIHSPKPARSFVTRVLTAQKPH